MVLAGQCCFFDKSEHARIRACSCYGYCCAFLNLSNITLYNLGQYYIWRYGCALQLSNHIVDNPYLGCYCFYNILVKFLSFSFLIDVIAFYWVFQQCECSVSLQCVCEKRHQGTWQPTQPCRPKPKGFSKELWREYIHRNVL